MSKSLLDNQPAPPDPSAAASSEPSTTDRAKLRQRTRYFAIFSAALVLCFIQPLLGLFRLSLNNDLYSHILLVPLISVYLIWLDKRKLTPAVEPVPRVSVSLLLSGLVLLAAGWIGSLSGWKLHETDFLSLMTLAFLLCFSGGFAAFFGGRILRTVAFPMAFLIFMAPMPVALENGIVNFLQHGSAEASYLMLKITGMPVFRDGTRFTMPGVSIEVAPECSGIRSSLVLFMSGWLAAHFFLRKPWAKITLAAAVIPLGIFRNALRIFTLSQLAVRVDPSVLNSGLHHHGGPLFFAVSLVPFFILIWFLRKYEVPRKTNRPIEPAA